MGIIEQNQIKRVKPKIRGHKFRRAVYWQGVLMQNGLNKLAMKQELHVSVVMCK